MRRLALELLMILMSACELKRTRVPSGQDERCLVYFQLVLIDTSQIGKLDGRLDASGQVDFVVLANNLICYILVYEILFLTKWVFFILTKKSRIYLKIQIIPGGMS